MKHVVIIGNGIAGITAARHIRKLSDHRITVISAESDHFYSRPALMYIYMGQMTYEDTKPYEDWFWEKNRIELVRDWVESINTDSKLLSLAQGWTIAYDTLLIATGSVSNKFNWSGHDLDGVQGLYNLQDLAQMEHYTHGIERGVVVGGGLIGIEVAEMLHSRHIPVTFLVREKEYMDYVLPEEEARMIGREIRRHGIDLHLGTELSKILPDESGRVRAVVDSSGQETPCEFVVLTVGVRPNISLLKNSNIETDHGVLVDEYMRTNIPDVYAVGDCAEFRNPKPGHPRIEQLWYTGRRHGETVAQTISGNPTEYERGIWFNSAKFMDIEYQTYGFVANTPRSGEQSLYWEHSDGCRAVRIVYSESDHCVIGFNVFGIRYRHQVCAAWIYERKSIEYVLEHLRDANFDPEFFRKYEPEVVRLYNSQNGSRPVKLKRRMSWRVGS